MERHEQKKETYTKPVVTKVTIVPDELAVTGCKMPTSMTGPTTGCVASMCRNPGS